MRVLMHNINASLLWMSISMLNTQNENETTKNRTEKDCFKKFIMESATI
jgi:hypothetical protein